MRSGRVRVGAGIVALALAGALACGAWTSQAAAAGKSVKVSLQVVNGGYQKHKDWPFFSRNGKTPLATLVLTRDATVTLTITNHDDGADKVPGTYAKVSGTIGKVEMVAGKEIHALSATDVSHTLTVEGLGLNIPLPPATSDGHAAVVTVTFHTPAKAGTYTWQCYAPCGTGSDGWGGPMVSAGYMAGLIKID